MTITLLQLRSTRCFGSACQYYNPVATRNYSKYVGVFGSKFKQCQRAFSFSSSRVITYLRAYRKSPLLNYVSCGSQILGQSSQYKILQPNQFVLMVQYQFNSFTCRSFKIQINSISGLIPGQATIYMPWPYARSPFFQPAHVMTLLSCKLLCNRSELSTGCHERTILVPRAYDPSGLRQESRALGATIMK